MPIQRSESLAPYTARAGEELPGYIEAIVSPPNRELSGEDKQAVFEFANDLANGRLNEVECPAGKSFIELYQTSATEASQAFYLGYFNTPEGKEDLRQLGVDGPDPEQIVQVLDDIESVKARITSKNRKKIASNSLEWYKDELAERLLDSPESDWSYESLEPLRVNYEP